MSYAEEFFGVREMEALTLADNLAWFGKDSYVYKSSDLMNKVLNSVQAMTNPISALYCYLWLREKGLDTSTYFPAFSKIAVYNKDFGEQFEFYKILDLSNGSSLFAMAESLFTCAQFESIIDANILYTDMLNYDNYPFCRWMNSDDTNLVKNWPGRTNLKMYANDRRTNLYEILAETPGFIHGLDSEVKESLIARAGYKANVLTKEVAEKIVSLRRSGTVTSLDQMLVRTQKVIDRTNKYIRSKATTTMQEQIDKQEVYTTGSAASIPLNGITESQVLTSSRTDSTYRGTLNGPGTTYTEFDTSDVNKRPMIDFGGMIVPVICL